MIPAGVKDKKFYELLESAAIAKGYKSLVDYYERAPKYWNDEKAWELIFPMAAFENSDRQFIQRKGKERVPVMAVYLSEEADTPLISSEGTEVVTGDLPRMGNGVLFTLKNYYDELRLAASDADAFNRLASNLRIDSKDLLRGINAQRTFTAYQVESQGFYISSKKNNSGGLERMMVDFKPNAKNKRKAGGFNTTGSKKGVKKAWSDVAANPLGDLDDMFYYAWSNRILSRSASESVFRMNGASFYTLKSHPSTKNRIALWKTGNLIPSANIEGYEVTDADIANFLKDTGRPAIEVVDYFGFVEVLNKDTQKIETEAISAFADNTVVLRPAGAVGRMQWAAIPTLFDTSDVPSYKAEGGATTIQEDTKSATKNAKKISANSLCAPVPDFIEKFLFLDFSVAAS